MNGDVALSESTLVANRTDYPADILRHDLDSAWWRERTPCIGRIEIPVLSAGNWGGPGMHLRGNIEGFLGVASKDKWLSLHTGKHWTSFYLPEYVAMQKRFFGFYLRGEQNGWDREPRVKMVIRDPRGEGFRTSDQYPLPDLAPQRYYLDARSCGLSADRPGHPGVAQYDAMGDGVTFSTPPLDEDLELNGPISARLWVSSTTNDMDLFATVRAFNTTGDEWIIDGAHEPAPISRGWLRLSQRKLDPVRSTELRPFHTHDEVQKLAPGEVYEVDLEIWPTSAVLPAGYRLALTLMGKDFQFPGIPGRILHNHPHDRDKAEFKGVSSVFTGGLRASYLLWPKIPRGK
jgi:predicted acyl esterase